MDEQPATMVIWKTPVRVTVLEPYGKGGLNYRVRLEEDCRLEHGFAGKKGNTYIAATRTLTFDTQAGKAP